MDAPPATAVPAPAAPARGNPLAVAAVIAVATIFGLTYGLTAPLIARDLAARHCSEAVIGFNAAMHAVGVLAIAGFLPRLAARCGPRLLMLLALALSAAMLGGFWATGALWAWFILRLGVGVAAEVLFVCSETWINQLCDDGNRGRSMAIYTAALSLGFAGGPAILSVLDAGGTPYVVGAAIALAAALPLLNPWLRTPAAVHPATRRPLAFLRLAPIALTTTLLNAGVETAGLSFITLYAVHMQWSEAAGMRLVTTLMVGAILLQLPIGWLADRVDRRKLVLALAALSTVGALIWPLLFAVPWLAYTVVFIWGGLFVGIYTVMLALVGARFSGGDLVGIYAVMSVFWGLGALLGPTAVGVAMEASPQYGLPVAIAAGCGLFTLFAWCRRAPT